jgi:FkbM family methyltransferase
MSVKNAAFRFIRRRGFQPFWETLHHLSRIGQNYWSSTVDESGELHALDFARQHLQGDGTAIVVDVGANIGQFAMAAAARLKPARIFSFEPSRRTFEFLQAAIRDAGLQDLIVPQRFALSDREEQAVLYSSHEGAAIASLYDLHHPPSEFKPEFSETVTTTTLDKFCAEHGVERIDYLKIDVEGHEFSVLRGASRMLSERRIRYIQFEFGEANIDSRTFMRDFFELLAPDFEFYRVVSNGLRKVPAYHANLEVFATINYLAARKSR